MRSALFVALALVACGDNRPGIPTSSGDDDTIVDAPVIQSGPPRAVAVAGDFTSGDPGVMSVLDVQTMTVMQNVAPAGAVDSDPILRKFGDELFVINRSANNITILNASDYSLVEQIGTGAGSNPQDVAVVGNNLFVPVYGGSGIVELTRGSTTITRIALAMDDPDGHPNCASIYRVDNALYVACQNLDGSFVPRTAGKIYVVDVATLTVNPAKTITLTYQNPFSLIERVPGGGAMAGDLVVATVTDFSGSTGCAERFTPGATPTYQGCLAQDSDLVGWVNRIDFLTLGNNDTLMWLAVAEAFPNAALRGYDLGTQALWADPISPSTEQITEAVACPDGSIVASDSATGSTGLRLYNSGAVEQTTSALSIGIAHVSGHGIACY
ncbi:MAG TPA: hypothetical protein VGO00_15315 [Kofleriaceae bacterium]|nr:hypothetical protein [Kofleriaceae bacterium]